MVQAVVGQAVGSLLVVEEGNLPVEDSLPAEVGSLLAQVDNLVADSLLVEPVVCILVGHRHSQLGNLVVCYLMAGKERGSSQHIDI